MSHGFKPVSKQPDPRTNPIISVKEADRYRSAYQSLVSVPETLLQPFPRVHRDSIEQDIDASIEVIRTMEQILVKAKRRLATL